jgi:hypothetical protein
MKTETKNIYTKLLAFQKLGISVKKSSTNPHFRSTYADLNEVLDKVKKPLNDMGIVILFTPQAEGLGTTLHDTESGTEITSFMRYVGNDNAQKTLACNTYFRRGSLVSLLGLEDEDNDGNDTHKTPVREVPKVEQKVEREFIENPIDKIKATKDMKELTALFNSMPPAQQGAEHILAIFKAQKATFTKNK